MTIKEKVLKELKEITDCKNEDDFNEMMANYNAYDDEYRIQSIFGIVSDIVFYDYISKECDCYGQVSYYSRRINKNILLTQDDDFRNYSTLDEVLEAIKSYETEVAEVEYNMKHNK